MDDEEPTEPAGRDWTRIALLAGIVLAAVTAAMLVPSLASDGLRGSPIDSVLPGERFDDGRAAGGGGGGGFGALNPGDTTGVGGETGFDKDTFASNDTEVHFEVESSTSSYWRTGTYGTYTGTGWERDVETSPVDGPIETSGLTGEQVVYEVEFERPASALPTAWQPNSVNGIDGLEVTETGSVVAPDTVDAGASFSGVSSKPVRDVDVLRSAGSAYPEPIEQQYTQLPEDTPSRVGRFTEELTKNDETPYDAAKTIQNWLRSEKGYSLQASRQSDHMADTFIFEMDEGYCEYFATAMTAMLRSQDIPARYTVGYSTGQQIDGNRYQVRGMNAHAWVEVYFPDVGWVRFDPTPGGSRLQAQQETLESEAPDLEYNVTEAGSPGEVFEPGEVREVADNESETGDENGDEDDGLYDVSLNRTAVPGVAVEVSVEREESPVIGATVLFNGEAVGVTDAEGMVTATVPAADELRIRIEPPDDRVDDGASSAGTLVPPAPGNEERGARYLSLGSTGWRATGTQQADGDNVTVVDVETEASVSVTGDQFPGADVTVVVTVDDIAIGDADLFLDGQRIGATGSDGRATVTLPSEPGNSTIAAERGRVFGQTDVRIQTVELDVDTGLLALPLTDATAEVTADGDGIADAPISVDGAEVARTGPDGTASIRLPLAASATLRTQRSGLTREATVDGLFLNVAGVTAGTGFLIGFPLVVAYRRGYRPNDLIAGVVAAATWGRDALVRVVRWITSLFRAGLARVSQTIVHLSRLAAGKQTAADLGAALLRWLEAKRRQLAGAVTVSGTASATDDEEPGAVPETVPTVRAAWHRFLDVVDAEAPERQTPGELATTAVEEADLPAEPVERLRDAFREVEYGDRPASDRAERVKRAIDAIEQAAEQGSDEPAPEETEEETAPESTPAHTAPEGVTDAGPSAGGGQEPLSGTTDDSVSTGGER